MSKQYEENPSANNINFKLIFLMSLLFIAQCLGSNSRIFLSPTFCVCSHTSVIVGFFLRIIDPFINNLFDSYTHKLKTAMQCRLLIDNSTLHDGPLIVGCLNFSQSIYPFIFPSIYHSSTSIHQSIRSSNDQFISTIVIFLSMCSSINQYILLFIQLSMLSSSVHQFNN